MAEARPPAVRRGLERESPSFIRRTPLNRRGASLERLDDADSPSGLVWSNNRRIPQSGPVRPELGGATGEAGVVRFLQEGSEAGGRRSELTSTFFLSSSITVGRQQGEGASVWPPFEPPPAQELPHPLPPPLTFTSADSCRQPLTSAPVCRG